MKLLLTMRKIKIMPKKAWSWNNNENVLYLNLCLGLLMYSRKMCKFDLKPYPRIVSQNNTAINNILGKILEKRIRKIGSLNECCRSLKVDSFSPPVFSQRNDFSDSFYCSCFSKPHLDLMIWKWEGCQQNKHSFDNHVTRRNRTIILF